MAHNLCKVNSSINDTWFDYTILDLSSATLNNPMEPRKTKSFELRNSKEQVAGRNSSHGILVKRFEMFAKNKQICERLKRVSGVHEELLACLEEKKDESILEVRRRCFCESIGRKFCAACRRKLNKELSHELPRILVNLAGSNCHEGITKDQFPRDTVRSTRAPSLPTLLKQASEAFTISNNSINALDSLTPAYIYATDDNSCEISSVVPGLIKSSSTSSLVIPETPNTSEYSLVSPTAINEQDDENNQNKPYLSTVVPRLPSISIATDAEKDEIAREDTEHIENVKNGDISRQLNQRSSITGQLDPGLPWYSYPVQPVLMDMKYINFSIYHGE